MRVDLAKAQRVATGDEVVIRLRLPKGVDYARISIWSAVGDDDLSPHIQQLSAKLQVSGPPNMLQPMYTTLSRDAPKKVLRFIAEEHMAIVVRQEKDVAKDMSAKARINTHGKAFTSFRLRCRNAIRALGRSPLGSLWPSQWSRMV